MQKQQEIYPLSDTVKAEARFRVKTKIRPEATISEQFHLPLANVKKQLLSQLWNLRGWHAFCFNSQFLRLQTKCKAVVSEKHCGVWSH